MQEEKAEEAPKKVTIDVIDEVCEDEAYNSNVQMNRENFVDEIWIAPEGHITFDRDTLEDKLQAVGIKAKEIRTMNEDCGDWKAFIQIEPSRKEKMTEAMFPLMVSGMKMEFLAQINFTTPSIWKF